MAIIANTEFNGVSLTDAYIKALVNIDVGVYANTDQRNLGRGICNKKISISPQDMATIYGIVKQYFDNPVDELNNEWDN